MKNLIYILVLLLFTLNLGCNNSDENQSISIKDSNREYTFEAFYPIRKTDQLEKYVDSVLNNNIPLNKQVDMTINLVNGETFNLTATEGVLEIKFDKKNSSITGYLKVKQLTEGIKEELSKK